MTPLPMTPLMVRFEPLNTTDSVASGRRLGAGMRWRLRDSVLDYELEVGRATARVDSDEAGGSGSRLEPHDATEVIGRLAQDPVHLRTLRDIHLALVGSDGGRSLSHFVVVAGLFDALHMARLSVWALPRQVVRTDPVEHGASEAVAALQDLAAVAPPQPVVAVVVPLTAALAHQIEILARAAATGAPFCEECECD